jgi:hypothetical protein
MAQKMVTVAPLPRAYRFRDDETGRMLDFGQGDTRIPELMAKNLHAQGLIADYKNAEAVQQATEEATDLPEDVPGRKHLIAAGHTTMAKVRALETFDGIDGIGTATATKLGEYLSDSK